MQKNLEIFASFLQIASFFLQKTTLSHKKTIYQIYKKLAENL